MLVLLCLTVSLLVWSSSFQTFVAKKAAAYFSKTLNTTVTIDKISVRGLTDVRAEGLFIRDLSKDTLFYAKSLRVTLSSLRDLDLKNDFVRVHAISLQGAKFFLRNSLTNQSNLAFILNLFSSGHKTGKKTPFTVKVDRVDVVDFHFKFKREIRYASETTLINYSDLDVNHIQLHLHHVVSIGDSLNVLIDRIALQEKSGFTLKNLSGHLIMNGRSVEINHLLLQTPHTRIGDYYKMDFKDFADFDLYERKVSMTARLRKCTVDFRDIAFFTPGLENVDLLAGVNGDVKGPLDNLKATHFTITAFDQTMIRGYLHLKGLPDINATFMDLDLDAVVTDKNDLASLFYHTGNAPSVQDIPSFLADMKTIRFNGEFDGFIKDFVARGHFTTALGDVISDINMKLPDKGLPSYQGHLILQDFNIGRVVGVSQLGRTSYTAEIKGSGFSATNNIDAVNSHVNYIDFNHYRYHDIRINGDRKQKLFLGHISVNDANLAMQFEGMVNLNSPAPAFKFKADIKKANLKNLKWVTDSISVATNLDMDFSGNSFSSLDGSISIGKTQLTRGTHAYLLDSILLTAGKQGNVRRLVLNSCFLNASVTGQYDFSALPQTVASIIGKYLPSLHLETKKRITRQVFDLAITIKDLDPLLKVLSPSMGMIGAGQMKGHFDSGTQLFSLSGEVNQIQFEKVGFDRVLFDVGYVEKRGINAAVSVDSITLNDKILAREINLSSFLKHDSIDFNVKLADAGATNRLDLNGLLAFNEKNASLSILPSELTLQNLSWKVNNDFSIDFTKNKTQIKGFEITHADQKLQINGNVSAFAKDSLQVHFDNFGLSNLDQLLKGYKLSLGGAVNGDASITALLNKPSLHSALKVDSLRINNALVGNLTLHNQLNAATSILSVQSNIYNQGAQVVRLEGEAGLSKQNDHLNATIQLNEAESVLMQPLVEGLLSNIKGHLTTNLTLSGTVGSPVINGGIFLKNTEFTIDYLKTHYKINDTVTFHNGLINISDLKLADTFNHTALINGSVNLHNVNSPVFDANVHATNFQCLNTTEKDNEQYYGTAYATGDFDFEGPLQAMNIDIDATTRPGTTFNIPLNHTSSVSKKEFVTFVYAKTSADSAVKTKNSGQGVDLSFNLTITPDATVRLLFDEKIGDIIKGAGSGNISMGVSRTGTFNMLGTYEIDHGTYLFTSQNVLNKLFSVERGSTIRFNGDPEKAILNVLADYQARAEVSPLYDAANIQPTTSAAAGGSTVLTNCQIHLLGSLDAPTFSFALRFPEDPNIENDLQTYLGSTEVVTSQAMLFLVSNQFIGIKLTLSNGTGIVSSTGVQFLSNQLSNVLNTLSSHLDLNFRSLQDFGFDYRLNNRVNVVGNLATTSTSTTSFGANLNPIPLTQKNVTGNLELGYAVNKKRNLIFRVFRKSVPLQIIQLNSLVPSTIGTQGVGLSYQVDFSSIKSIFKRPKTVAPIVFKAPKTDAEITDSTLASRPGIRIIRGKK